MESKESRSVPKDAQVIQSILKDMGIQEYENRVVNQLLDFAYRYVTTVLDDAQVFSQYARKKAIDSDDVKLAIQLQVEKMYSNPPPRDLLLDIARSKNGQPLPPIKSQSGTRLPPDRYSLTSSNFRLRSSAEIRSMQQQQSSLFQQQSSSSPASAQLRNNSLLSGANLTRQTIQMQTQKSVSNRPSSSVQNLFPASSTTNGSNQASQESRSDTQQTGGGVKRKLDDSIE